MEVVRGKEIVEMSPVREEVASVEVEEDWFDVQFADVKDGVFDHEPETGLVRDARSRTSLPLEEFQWEKPRAMRRIKPETKVVLWLALLAFLVALIVAVITIGVLGSR